MIYYEGVEEVTFPALYIVCIVYSIWKNTVYSVGLEGHATLQMSALYLIVLVLLSLNFNTNSYSLLDIEVNALRYRATPQRAADAEIDSGKYI